MGLADTPSDATRWAAGAPGAQRRLQLAVPGEIRSVREEEGVGPGMMLLAAA